MKLSFETPKTRRFVLGGVWAFVILHVLTHTVLVRDYLILADRIGLRGSDPAPTPLTNVYPGFAADAHTWVRHAISLLEGDSIRLRFTTIDNAPLGREVHWNSMYAWVLAGAGWVYHWISGVPLTQGVEQAALWVPPLLLITLMVPVSSWAARHIGALGGAWLALAMAGNARLSEGFFPKYADHHGLLAVAALGVILGFAVAGAGWWSPLSKVGRQNLLPETRETVRAGAVFSAIAGAFGLWVSAASVIPTIAIVGIAGLVATVIGRRHAEENGANFDAESWRVWGRLGGGLSLGFYLLEYFPNHLGFRLEANHPAYAAAWWGGAELIGIVGERISVSRAGRKLPKGKVALIGATIIAPPLIIVLLGAKAFVVMDPFLNHLHNNYIQEFLPLWRAMFGSGWRGVYMVFVLDMMPFFIGVGIVAAMRRKVPITVLYAVIVAGCLLLMGWKQSRWILTAGGSLCCMALVLMAFAKESLKRATFWALFACAVTGLYIVPPIERLRNARKDIAAKRISPGEAHHALARDIASAIRSTQPQGDITLLSSPNSSSTIGYYGRFRTLGTLYWENSEGLKAAASIYSAKSEQEAADLIKKYGVTHIAIQTEENFIEPYFRLFRPEAKAEELQTSFCYNLFYRNNIPVWLRIIPYKIPDDLSALNQKVFLFQVNFQQTPADAIYHLALWKVVCGNLVDAERDFITLTKGSADSFQPWLRVGELMMLRKDWETAEKYSLEGIKKAPAALRASTALETAAKFYRSGQVGPAIRVYRLGLSLGFDFDLATSLAFILATTKEDAARNGREAVILAERALKTAPNSPVALNAAAVAYAEMGRFGEAIDAADRALANSQIERNAAASQVSMARLAAFKAGKPWRE